MSFKIEIEELGKIRNSEFEFKPFLIFSGESNSGKSYTAFLIYHLIRLFEYNISTANIPIHHFDDFIKLKYQENADLIKNGENVNFTFKAKDFIDWFDSTAYQYIGSLIGYDNFKCKIHLNAILPDFEISVQFPIIDPNKPPSNELPSNVIFVVNNEVYNAGVSFTKTRSVFVLSLLIGFELRKELFHNEEDFDREFIPILLPPSRGSIISGFGPSSTIGMYKDFMEDFADAKIQDPINKPVEDKDLDQLLDNLFQGNLVVKEGELEYHINKDEKIPITAAASSIKELSPIFLILKKYKIKSLSILFEEPEAHLHPTLQQKIALLLVYIINNGGYIQSTTHSDYLLSQIINLIKLDQIKTKNLDKFEELIIKLDGVNENLSLSASKVGAYCFEKQSDGYVIIKPQINNEGNFRLDTFDKAVDKMMTETETINECIELL